MAEQQNKAKNQKPPAKSFMTAGPTLHYSHANVYRCWMLAILAFAATCLFWSKILAIPSWLFGFTDVSTFKLFDLGQFLLSPLSIFEYPWQILVLGLLMGILAVVPPLVSQLLSFKYSIPFILMVVFLADLPGFAIFVLISSIASACRPLRFRSRFIAIALCMAPQLFYWVCFGSAEGLEPIAWGFSFAPWVCACLAGLAIAAEALGIGHFTRYRPGLVWTFTLLTLVIAFGVFEAKIGFTELAYQQYVAKNNPEEVSEFHDHSITAALDKTLMNPLVRRYLSEGFFYPTEPILLRAELKKETQAQLRHNRWPSWFILPEELKYQEKREWLNRQYQLFISPPKPWWMPTLLHAKLIKNRSANRRMPIALYYKALLNEYSPDIRLLGQKEVLRFYDDYPYRESLPVWYQLYKDFGVSAESLEARWRIAMHLAGQGKFERADELLAETQKLLAEKCEHFQNNRVQSVAFFAVFQPPRASAMTAFKLTELQRKVNQLRSLIGPENRSADSVAESRLARFVMLNPYSQGFGAQLRELLAETDDADALVDNILLAKMMLTEDPQLRAEQLKELAEKFRGKDGGIQALYELALLKVRWWNDAATDASSKKKYLDDARATLTSLVTLYPASIFTEQSKSILASLPASE